MQVRYRQHPCCTSAARQFVNDIFSKPEYIAKLLTGFYSGKYKCGPYTLIEHHNEFYLERKRDLNQLSKITRRITRRLIAEHGKV